MAYFDRELLIATQIAYYDIDPTFVKLHPDMPLRDLLKQNPSIYNKIKNSLDKDGLSELEKSRFQSSLDLYNNIMKDNSEYGDWVIKAVKDDNDNSGFYGCLIETSKDSAIVGFRGSESASGDQFEKDWINADFGLLNNKLTGQQGVAAQFMDDINIKFKYSNYATSGHSLGGNLSVHAAISAPEDMQLKITQCKSYDGPGFSDEYIKENKKSIDRVAKVIDHYQWSVVGALLYQIPGSNYQSIMTNPQVYNNYDLDALIQKHDVSFVLNEALDENGNVQKGEMDRFAASVGELSRQIENCPKIVGDMIIWTVARIATMTDAEKLAVGAGVVTGLVLLAVNLPIVVLCGALTIAGMLLVKFLDPDFFGAVLIPFLCGTASETVKIVNGILYILSPFIDLAFIALKIEHAIIGTIINGIADIIKGLSAWINENFNAGYRYSTENPYIKLSTYKLRNYADRIAAVNSKIRDLDHRLNGLYSKFSIWDWWTIAKVDICTEYSWKLERCRSYLNETAEEFEAVELKLLSQIESV